MQGDKAATRGLISETVEQISAQADPRKRQDQMHELSFYYMSFLRERAARQGPQQNLHASNQAAARRQYAVAQHAELAQRVHHLRSQLALMSPPDRAVAQQQLHFMMQQEQELLLQINASK